MKAKPVTLLLDLDEVLVDFVKGACDLFGISHQAVMDAWVPGQWDCMIPMNVVLKKHDEVPLTQSMFWREISSRGPTFWSQLESLPWMLELLQEVFYARNVFEVYIVTAPSLCPSSYEGKIQWIKRQFGDTFDEFLITSHKHLLAKEGVVLIDDRESTIQKFNLAGGKGILFPRMHNSLYRHRDNPLKHVLPALRDILNTK